MDRKIVRSALIFFFTVGLLYAQQEGTQQFEGFNLAGYKQGGQKAWDVKGDTADIAGTTITLTNIVANVYEDPQMNLTAKTGTVDQVNGLIHLEKDVVITSETGAQLKTQSLDWERARDLVTTEDKVLIKDEKVEAVGTGVVAHPNLKTAEMQEDITLKIKTQPEEADSQIVTITCDGPLEVDQAKSKAVLQNNVVAVQGNRELKADRMELYFDEETNQIKELICLGHVMIKMGENTSYSEKAVYTAKDQKLVLSGQPKLILMTEGEGVAPFGN